MSDNNAVKQTLGDDELAKMLTPTEGYTPVPVGSYLGEFVGSEAVQVKDRETGAMVWRLKFKWKVTVGDHAGKVADCLTDAKIGPANATRAIVEGLLDRAVGAGESGAAVLAAVRGCVGKRYAIRVMDGKQGGKPAVRMVMVPVG